MKVRKANGKEYEPATLTAFQRSFDRHLRDLGQQRSIITDREFEGSRQVLQAKRRDLHGNGRGCRPHAADPITPAEEDELWETGQLGSSSPRRLLRSVWYYSTMHFGWRGRDEQRKVQLGDFEIHEDPSDGLQFVQFCVERGTKTRTGLEGQQERAFSKLFTLLFATN